MGRAQRNPSRILLDNGFTTVRDVCDMGMHGYTDEGADRQLRAQIQLMFPK